MREDITVFAVTMLVVSAVGAVMWFLLLGFVLWALRWWGAAI